MTQWSSRCCNVSTARAAPSALLRPQTQQNGNDGVVTLAPETTVIKGGEKSLALFRGQPVAEPDAMFLDTLDSANSCS